jgi:hypothetical protein
VDITGSSDPEVQKYMCLFTTVELTGISGKHISPSPLSILKYNKIILYFYGYCYFTSLTVRIIFGKNFFTRAS